jgi:hypothetical protein
MKSIITEKKEKEEYPKLMVSSIGRIVLFTSYKKGVLVDPNEVLTDDIGCYSNCWAMDDFKPFNGTVTLSND